MPSGMLLDVAKYLGSLQYNVWKKMLDIITVGEALGPPAMGGCPRAKAAFE